MGDIEDKRKAFSQNDVLEKLHDVFEEPYKIEAFLDECEYAAIEPTVVREYLELYHNDEWEKVKCLDIPHINRPSISGREFVKAYNLVSLIRKGNLDYYEKKEFKLLGSDTQKFVMWCCYWEIESCRKRTVDYIGIPYIIEFDLKRRGEAVNCWKFVEIIK